MTHHTDQDRVWDLMDEIGFAMLVTLDGEGDELRVRPMHAHALREEDAIVFLTDRRHHKDGQAPINDTVCVTFAGNSSHRYVSVTGAVNVLADRPEVDQLWEPSNKAFGRDKNDPNIRSLRVKPSIAEFWDSPGKIITTVKMATAALTGANFERSHGHASEDLACAGTTPEPPLLHPSRVYST